MWVEVESVVSTAPVQDDAGVSERVLEVAAMFGLGLDGGRSVAVVPTTRLELSAGRLVFVTGPSGSGKTTLLRALRSAAAALPTPLPVFDFAELPTPPDRPLVDALETDTLAEALSALSVAGLNDAFVMLRRPAELSDGQRYRFKLAQAIATLPKGPQLAGDDGAPRALVIADEFGATLDRLTASVVARNLRRWVTRAGVCLVAATTHDDLLEPLDPDVLIEQHLGGSLTLVHRGEKP